MQVQFSGRFFYQIKQNPAEKTLTLEQKVMLHDNDGVPHLSTFNRLSQEIDDRVTSLRKTEYQLEEASGIRYISPPIYPFELRAGELKAGLQRDFLNPQARIDKKEDLEAYAKTASAQTMTLNGMFVL